MRRVLFFVAVFCFVLYFVLRAPLGQQHPNLSRLLIVGGASLVLAFVAFNGLLMLISPRLQKKFEAWWGRAYSFSKPKEDWKPGIMLEHRLAGFGIVAMTLWALIYVALHGHVSSGSAQVPPTPSTGSAQMLAIWLKYATPVPFLLLGCYMLLRPQTLAVWLTRSAPHRAFTPKFIERTARSGRFIGMIAFAFGVFLLMAILRIPR
jgi:hypothetical protein